MNRNNRIKTLCPICGKEFSLNPSEFRKYEKRGFLPACSNACGMEKKRRIEENWDGHFVRAAQEVS